MAKNSLSPVALMFQGYNNILDRDDSRRKKLLDDTDWNAVSRQLIGFIINWANTNGWYGDENTLLSSGNSPTDIVQRVIEKAYSGQRNWKPDKGNLLNWLFWQVRSELSNLYAKKSSQKELATNASAGDAADEVLQSRVEYAQIDTDVIFELQPATLDEQVLYDEAINRRCDLIYQACDGDTELEALVLAIKFVGDKAQDLADTLNKPVEEVYVALRRLRRRVKGVVKDE